MRVRVSDVEAYAKAAFSSGVEEVAATGEGGRNLGLYKVAAGLGCLVHLKVFSEQDVEDALLMATTLPQKEALAVIRRGLRDGMSTPRDVETGEHPNTKKPKPRTPHKGNGHAGPTDAEKCATAVRRYHASREGLDWFGLTPEQAELVKGWPTHVLDRYSVGLEIVVPDFCESYEAGRRAPSLVIPCYDTDGNVRAVKLRRLYKTKDKEPSRGPGDWWIGIDQIYKYPDKPIVAVEGGRDVFDLSSVLSDHVVISPAHGKGQGLGAHARNLEARDFTAMLDVGAENESHALAAEAWPHADTSLVGDLRTAVHDAPEGFDSSDLIKKFGPGSAMVLRKILAAAKPFQVERAREAVAEEPTTKDPDDGRPWQLAELLTTEFPPISELWVEWVQEDGIAIVAGPPGSGKSWLVWALALGVSLPLPGELVSHALTNIQRPALVVLGEDPPRRAAERLAKLSESGPCPDVMDEEVPLFVVQPPSALTSALDSPEGLKWLAQAIEFTGAKLVVLDTITSLCGLDLSDDTAVRRFLVALRAVRDKYGIDIILVMHVRKLSDQARTKGLGHNADSIFGSTHWRGLTDTIIMLAPEDHDAQRVRIYRAKSKDLASGSPDVVARLDKDTGRFVQLADLSNAGQAAFSTKKAREAEQNATAMLEKLRDAGRPLTAQEWAEAAGCTVRTLRRRLSDLIQDADGAIAVTTSTSRTTPHTYAFKDTL